MSKEHSEIITCPQCNKKIEYQYWDSVNVTLDSDLKEKVLDKSIFKCKCPCGFTMNIIHPLLYHDMNEKFLIQYVSIEDAYDAICGLKSSMGNPLFDLVADEREFRVVTNIEDLYEKIHIFDAGFDDKVIEVMKSIFKRAYLTKEPKPKDFKVEFSPPDKSSKLKAEHDYHFKVLDYEKEIYTVVPVDREKFQKHSDNIHFQEKFFTRKLYVIDQSWADSILDGSYPKKDGFHSIIDDDLRHQKEKYETEYTDLKKKMSDINALDDDGYTLLKYAVLADDYDEVKSLLEHGADPNVKDCESRTALHWGFQYGASVKTLDLLLQHGANINAIATHKLRPLDLMDTKKPVEYLKHFLDIGASCNKDMLLRSYANYAENVDCITLLLEKGGSLDKRDRNDFNANCEAICNNHSCDFLEKFLEIGGDPNAKYWGRPCFFSDLDEPNPIDRSEGYYFKRLKILFEHGADINLTDRSGCTAIMRSCKLGCREEMIHFLLSFNPDLNLEDSDGKDVYDYLNENETLSQRNKARIFEMLIMYENMH